MKNKNYKRDEKKNTFHNKKSEITETIETIETIETPSESIIDSEMLEEVVHTVTQGNVSGCAKLNVRKEANQNAEILCVLDESTELLVDKTVSTDEFYKIITSDGVDGFCMKQYIDIK